MAQHCMGIRILYSTLPTILRFRGMRCMHFRWNLRWFEDLTKEYLMHVIAPNRVTARTVSQARKLMVSGLVVSVLGNRLIDGGVDGLVAAGFLPLAWIAVAITIEKFVALVMPLYAQLLQRFSPDKALITSDFLEAALAFVSLMLITFLSDSTQVVLLAFLFIMMFLLPVIDVAEEFYGAKLAAEGKDEALKFNAMLYSLLALTGLVFALPLGSVLSGISISILLAMDAALSVFGGTFRLISRRKFPVSAFVDADMGEFDMRGKRLPFRQFLHDIFRSGPASPALSLVLQIIGGLTGQIFMLWTASKINLDAHLAMGVVLCVFGVSATVGPQLARWLKPRFGTKVLLMGCSAASLILIITFEVLLLTGAAGFVAGLVFVFLNVILNRCRLVVLETHRQTYFKNAQFSRIMSWSYSFGAVGTLTGVWLAYASGVASWPGWGLGIAAALVVVTMFVMQSRSEGMSPNSVQRTPA